MHYVHLTTWTSSLFRTVSGSMIHIHFATIETSVTLEELGPFLGGERRPGRASLALLDVVKVHGLWTIIIAVVTAGCLVFFMNNGGGDILFFLTRVEGGIKTFSHLHKLTK